MAISRKLRGIIGVATTWAISFAAFGAIVGTLSLLVAALTGVMPRDVVVRIGIIEWIAGIARWGFMGALSGTAFAVSVIRFGRGNTIDDIPERRFGLWGAAAGAIGSVVVAAATLAALRLAHIPLPLTPGLLAGVFVVLPAMGGLLGNRLAVATLRAARRAPTTTSSFEPEPEPAGRSGRA